MNLYLGGFAGTYGGWGAPTSNQRLFLKLTDLTAPAPGKTFVFIDRRFDQVAWSSFFTDMSGFSNQPSAYTLRDYPGMIHNLGCGVSFADGRAEMKVWRDSRTTPPPYIDSTATYVASPRNLDVAWLQDHATRPK